MVKKASKLTPIHPDITPLPGYIMCLPYIQEDEVFRTAKESAGEDQKSRVIYIGPLIVDSAKITRTANCNVGDIIVHADSNKTFVINHVMYRFVHFTEVHGIWKV